MADLKKGRKHSGKRRNCSLRAISPFPTVFSKDFNSRHVKIRARLGKGYNRIKTTYNIYIFYTELYNKS